MLMNKVRSSSKGAAEGARKKLVVATLLFLGTTISASGAITLSPAEARRIGNKIWQNECHGTITGLTSWNTGEDFASLGIGHFIWYPAGRRGPFEESFPKFVIFANNHRSALPAWLKPDPASGPGPCPWKSHTEFYRASQTPQMKELREFLAKSVDLQAAFMVERLQQALPKMLAETSPENRDAVRDRFNRVSEAPQGCYALVDYVNFKGEGVLATERYAGQGWGLLQVLEGMSGQHNDRQAVKEFADSAKKVLRNRVRNSPPDRNESRWLPGWLNRINTYEQS